MNDLPGISVVVPLYNEEEVISTLFDRLDALIHSFAGPAIEIVLVNDGSSDRTAELILNKASADINYTAVSLSRNFGHQNAVTAGIEIASGTLGLMIIDGDLQDPPELLTQFYQEFTKGYEVVYAIRENRKENILKRMSYSLFYRILNSVSKIDLPLDSGDFCFIGRRVADQLIAMPEESRYLRGLRAWIGFKQIGITYSRESRHAGESKYTFSKLLKLAHDGLYNFSDVPLKLMTSVGTYGILISIAYFVYVLFARLYTDQVPTGFTTLIMVVIFFGCVQLLSLGIIGQYIIRIFFQVKGRPLYIIDKVKSHYYNGKV